MQVYFIFCSLRQMPEWITFRLFQCSRRKMQRQTPPYAHVLYTLASWPEASYHDWRKQSLRKPAGRWAFFSFCCFQFCNNLIRGEIVFRHVLLQVFHILLILLIDEFLALGFQSRNIALVLCNFLIEGCNLIVIIFLNLFSARHNHSSCW